MIPSFKIDHISKRLQERQQEHRMRQLRSISSSLDSNVSSPLPENITYFYGGVSSSYGVAKALVDQGLPIGVVLPKLTRRIKDLIQDEKAMVFYDTGAYTEFTRGEAITDDMWKGIYKNIPTFASPADSFIVLPDKIGDVQETFRRGEMNGELILDLAQRGFNLLLPIQAEKEFELTWLSGFMSTSADDFITSYIHARTPDGYEGYGLNQTVRRKIIPAIPAVLLRDNPKRVQEILDDLSTHGWSRVHLLGAGPKSIAKYARMYPNMHFYCDSVWQRGKAKNKPVMSEYTRGRSQALAVDRPTIYKKRETKELDFYRIERIIKYYAKSEGKSPEVYMEDWYKKSFDTYRGPTLGWKRWPETLISTMVSQVFDKKHKYYRKNLRSHSFSGNWYWKKEMRNLKTLWDEFDKFVALLPHVESIFTSGRRSGTSSQTATQISTSRTVQNMRSKVRDTEVNYNGAPLTIGAIVNLLEREMNTENPTLTRDGMRNVLTFLLWTGYPNMHSYSNLNDMRKNQVQSLELIKASLSVLETLEPIEKWNDKEYYYNKMVSNHIFDLDTLIKDQK